MPVLPKFADVTETLRTTDTTRPAPYPTISELAPELEALTIGRPRRATGRAPSMGAMTTTLATIWATTPRSWEINSSDISNSSFSFTISDRIWLL